MNEYLSIEPSLEFKHCRHLRLLLLIELSIEPSLELKLLPLLPTSNPVHAINRTISGIETQELRCNE